MTPLEDTAAGAHGVRPGLPRLVLVGAGHAHQTVLRSWAEEPWPSTERIVVSPSERQFYSGMVPGYLQARYDADELTLDVRGLAGAAGARFVPARALRVDPAARVVETDAGPVPFDLVSLDVGSVPVGLELPGVREHAFTLRPMDRAVALRRHVEALARERPRRLRGEPVAVAVVGAGAGGIEVALALDRRLRDCGAEPRVTLVERGPDVLDGYEARVRRRARGILLRRSVEVVLDAEAVAVEPGGLRFADGGRLGADAVVWVSGAAPPPLLDRSPLALGSGGFLRVDATLRAVDGAPVWGAGDCVHVRGHDLPKAGVYAVRQGPVLADNLRAALRGDDPRPYEPQRSFLSLLNTADGKALLRWKGVVAHARWAWWLKDRIDRRFMKRYRVPG